METAEFVAHFERTFPDLAGHKVLVALSGGCDSVALLHLLSEPALGLRLEAAHVHHGLRGAEADGDAEFCDELCRGLGVRFATIDLPDDDLSPATGEAAWRRRRYRALLGHAAMRSIGFVATAHHRDDVAEGVVVQLLRGAGPRAMAGIETRTGKGIIRPLLPFRRGEITAWLRRTGIEWREDSSNADTSRLRNRVRHELLPRLEVEVSGLRDHLVNLAGAIAETESYLADELDHRTTLADPWHPTGGVDLSSLRDLPRALRTRWLHRQMHSLGVSRTTRRQLELFHRMLDEGSPRSVTMGGRWRLRTARGMVWAEPPVDPPVCETRLGPGSPATFGVPGWMVRISSPTDLHPHACWRWCVHSDDTAIVMRGVKSEDRLVSVSGETRSAGKLIKKTLPRHLRAAWPVFCENDMIHWIPGVWQHPEPGDPSNRVVEVIRQ